MKSWLALLLLFVPPGDDPFTTGVRAYRDGRYADALTAFATAEAAAGAAAPPELLHNLALAALRSGDLRRAETAAEALAAHGGAERLGIRDFVFGSTAFQRCVLAAQQAGAVEAEPFAFDVAIALGESARRHWQAAACSRADWPEARRNVERALRKLDELRQQKAAAEQKRSRTQQPQPKPPRPAPPARPPERRPLPTPAERTAERASIAELLRRLEAKEKEKQILRAAQQQRRAGAGEKDW